MKKVIPILGLALLAVLAGCAAPTLPTKDQQEFERELGQAVRARYWAIQARQQPQPSQP